MESTNNRTGKTAAFIALATLACLPCCVPLITPLLAWLGLSTLGAAATGWYLGMAGIFVLGLAASIFMFMRNRINAARNRTQAAGCGCTNGCAPFSR